MAKATGKKYAKYVHEVKITQGPGEMRNDVAIDANNFPLMTHHLEAIMYHHTGSVNIPGKPFTMTMEEYKARHGIRYAFDLLPSHRSPMYHTYDEMFFFVGTNPDDPKDLGGELEFWLGAGEHAEKQVINKPTCIFVPAGMMHCPIDCTRLDRPFIEFIVAPSPIHTEFHPGVWPPGYKPRFK